MGDMRYAGQEEVDDSWAASAKPSPNTLLGFAQPTAGVGSPAAYD